MYRDANGRTPYQHWEDSLDAFAAARITKYVKRMEVGNFGNSEPVGSGVCELKINIGPGFRVYYGKDGDMLVLLLGGGSKKRQSRDIMDAIARWNTYKMNRRQRSKKGKAK